MDHYPTYSIDELRTAEATAKHLKAQVPLDPVEVNVIDTILVKIDVSIRDKHLTRPVPIMRKYGGM